MTYTDAQIKAFALIPHVTGSISFVCSSSIIHDILRDPLKRKRTYSRLLLGASVFDVLVSFMYFLGNWPIPEDSSAKYASGSIGTCTTQGFFIQTSLATPVYYLGLSMYYLFVLVLGWSDVRLERLERYVHFVAVVLGLGTAVVGLPLGLYNDDGGLWCWISSLPASCGNSPSGNPEDCVRGANAWIYRWAFFHAPIAVAIILITAIMCRVTWHVWSKERKSRKWRIEQMKDLCSRSEHRDLDTSGVSVYSFTEDDKLQKLTSRVFWQSVNYVLAFYVTWIFPTLVRWQQTLDRPVSPGLLVCMSIFLPLQGALNFGVYFRPRYLRFREKNPDSSVLEVWWSAVRRKLPHSRIRLYRMATDDEEENLEPSCHDPEEFPNTEYETTIASEVPSEEPIVTFSLPEDSCHSQRSSASRIEGANEKEDSGFSHDSSGVGGEDLKVNSGRRRRPEWRQRPTTLELDADVMDPAHMLMVLSQRNLNLTPESRGHPAGGACSRSTGVGSCSRSTGIGAIEEGSEEDEQEHEMGAREGEVLSRRSMWLDMMGVAVTLKESMRKSLRSLRSSSRDEEDSSSILYAHQSAKISSNMRSISEDESLDVSSFGEPDDDGATTNELSKDSLFAEDEHDDSNQRAEEEDSRENEPTIEANNSNDAEPNNDLQNFSRSENSGLQDV